MLIEVMAKIPEEAITILGWIIGICAGYFAFSVIIPFFIIPNLTFINKIPENKRLKKFAKKFKERNKEKTIKNVFNWLIKNYKGKEERHKVSLFAPKVFMHNIEKIIKRKQFLHCHVQNRVLMTLLINTGQFCEKDFEKKLEITNFGVIHQYLIIKINNEKFKVDPFMRILEEVKIQ